MLKQSNTTGTSEDPLAVALERYALAEEKVGEARLAQDQAIQSRFLAGWSTTLNTNIQFATKARKAVENSRLLLDSTKAAKKSQLQGRGMNPDDETAMSEDARAEIEAKEDDFVTQVEEAQGVMKNVRPHGSSTVAQKLMLAGFGHAGTTPQPGGLDCRTARVPQESIRDFVRTGTRD
jgi:hypothetical protein